MQRYFLVGERSLRAYLAGGNVRFLKDAEANLSVVSPDAKQYRDARFYLGITKAQLRKADESIEILTKLRENVSSEKGIGSQVDFVDRISLQLAYAHIKKYTDEGFDAAEAILNTLVSSENARKSLDLLLQSKSLQAFLYSVMAVYSTRVEKKPQFVRQAFIIGNQVLKESQASPAVRFEALNAMGIAWMRFAENSVETIATPEVSGGSRAGGSASTIRTDWVGIGDTTNGWKQAEDYFDQALAIVPNSVRVLQNKATLRLLQLDLGVAKDPSRLLKEAKEAVQRSLEINDQDQFPFYQMAQIAVKEKDKTSALSYTREGRNKPGAVKEKAWTKVESDADAL
jgi:tetratricopeptide (TPR) repeat protein